MHGKKRKKTWLFVVLIAVIVGVLGFSIFQALRIVIPQQREQNRFDELRDQLETYPPTQQDASSPDATVATAGEDTAAADEPPLYDYTVLLSTNSDMVGWLHINNTVVDYPVMKSSEDDPEYYLHRDFDRNYSFSGCLFVGKGCDAESDIFIIYGHSVKTIPTQR